MVSRTDFESELERLIAVIETKITALQPCEISHSGDWNAYWRAADAALDTLQAEEGAKVSRKYDGVALSMAGIRTTCTGGSVGVMRNWQTAARRKMRAAS